MPKKKAAPSYSNEDVALRGIEYVNKKETIKTLDAQCKVIRKPLEEYLDAFGKTLESGSVLAVVSHADIDVHLKKTLRMGKVMTAEALSILKENGLDDCIEQVEVIREDIVERLYADGKITDSLLKELYVEKPNYAFSVDLKEKLDAPK